MPDMTQSGETIIDRVATAIEALHWSESCRWDGDVFIFYLRENPAEAPKAGALGRNGELSLRTLDGESDLSAAERFVEYLKTQIGEDAESLIAVERVAQESGDGVLRDETGRRIVVESPTYPMAFAVEAARAALAERGKVYRRDRSLTVVDLSVERLTRYGRKKRLSLVTLDDANLALFLTDAAQFMKRKTVRSRVVIIPSTPSTHVVKQLQNYVGVRPMGLPALRGISAAPFLRPGDGGVCATPGYDEASGIWFDPGSTVFPPMPDLTPENALTHARAAVQRLARPLRGYRFHGSVKIGEEWDLSTDVDRAVAISMFVSMAAVQATKTRPAYLSDAPNFGSGKTMLVELPVIAHIGDDPALISATENDHIEELTKQLDSLLLSAMGYVILDNVEGDIARIGKLKVLLTASKIGVRLFHTQRVVEIDNNFLTLLSGNNAITGADAARRILRARIETGEERPDRIAYDFDPREEVLRDRGQIVIDALTILEAYRIAGRPKPNNVVPYGSYEEWARIVRDALVWAGLPDIVTSNEEAFESDEETLELEAMMLAWEHWGLEGEYTAAQLIKLAVEREPTESDGAGQRPEGSEGSRPFRRPELREALHAAAGRGPMINPMKLGRWFSKVRGRPRGGRRFELARAGRKSAVPPRTRWRCTGGAAQSWRCTADAGPSSVLIG